MCTQLYVVTIFHPDSPSHPPQNRNLPRIFFKFTLYSRKYERTRHIAYYEYGTPCITIQIELVVNHRFLAYVIVSR